MSIFVDAFPAQPVAPMGDPSCECLARNAGDTLLRSWKKITARVDRVATRSPTGLPGAQKYPCYAENMQNLSALSDEQLLDDIQKLLGSERQLLVQHLRYLIEIEDRRLALRAAYSSLFELCTEQLHMSEGQAFRRINAARLGRRFPLVLELIESGAVHLSALVILRDVLTEQNHEELLRQASGKSKRQVQALVAAYFPKPDAPSKIRKLPEQQPSPGGELALALQTDGPAESETPAPATPPVRAPAPPSVEPLSAARYKVQFTASQELRDKLELAQDRLSHANPSRDLAVVVEQAVDLLLAKLEKAKLAKTDRPAKQPRRAKHGAVTRAARRKTFERDGERCAYVDPVTGRRCTARGFLEVDHMDPRARGGAGDDPKNLRVVCKPHNRLLAEQAYGREHIERAIHLRQQKQTARSRAGAVVPTEHAETHDKLFKGLTHMGYRPREARGALDTMFASKSHGSPLPPIEELMREALLLLAPVARA